MFVVTIMGNIVDKIFTSNNISQARDMILDCDSGWVSSPIMTVMERDSNAAFMTSSDSYMSIVGVGESKETLDKLVKMVKSFFENS